ncbi:TIGR04141 family sporadically distributed protein [Rhizobium laguerreae]|uniref:DUF6119 family protein n=1 Tax=Rhizobium laguerreae TaxID=1076926 RepID=UPI001C917821|nr:DUF6119 family protein [Rhizobium laguerreae]MBY3246014.1 TIGR04141 family sporadically distributed protein [Rhizobium laguerreae]
MRARSEPYFTAQVFDFQVGVIAVLFTNTLYGGGDKTAGSEMTKAPLQSITLSLRLLKEGRTADNAFRKKHDLTEVRSSGGRLFTGQSGEVKPTWLDFVSGFSRRALNLVNRSCSAVLFLEVEPEVKSKGRTKKRTMVLTFGSGHHALEPAACERNFGLRVAINSIGKTNLRSVDVATLDATTFQRRIQSSRNAELQGFGIDTYRDLIRLASGTPTDKTFARVLSGRDALTISTRTDQKDVEAKCQRALKLFYSDDYRKNGYEWVDYIIPVRDDVALKDLNDLLFAELQLLLSGSGSDLHLAFPGILNPESSFDIGYFGIGLKSGQKDVFTELAIEDYVNQILEGNPGDIPDIKALKASHEIRVIKDGHGDKKESTSIYDCFVMETELNGALYVLFGGDWYAVDKKFHAEVEADYRKLLSNTPVAKGILCDSERELIVEMDKDNDLLNLDQVKLSPTGASGANLEPCDFFSRTKRFIHLKDGHGSSPISHLWNQGVVAAESFIRDEKFRKDLRAAAEKRQKKAKKTGFETCLPDGRSRPVASEYTVVYGIMRHKYKSSGKLGLPFFSKVSLRPVAQRIELMGFPVEIHLIEKPDKLVSSAPAPKGEGKKAA